MPIDPISISRSGLDVEWQRMAIAAQNLANENTTGVGGRGGYRPLSLVSGPAESFGTTLARGSRVPVPTGVRVIGIEARPNAVRRVYDPNHPAADAAGFVDYPNIDHAEEMVNLMRAARSYESSLTALALEQQMSMRALDIGRR